jgi:hypothetical protein
MTSAPALSDTPVIAGAATLALATAHSPLVQLCPLLQSEAAAHSLAEHFPLECRQKSPFSHCDVFVQLPPAGVEPPFLQPAIAIAKRKVFLMSVSPLLSVANSLFTVTSLQGNVGGPTVVARRTLRKSGTIGSSGVESQVG